MESTLNKGESPRVGRPPGSALSASNFYEGLLALSLDNIIGEMIDTKEWTHQPPQNGPVIIWLQTMRPLCSQELQLQNNHLTF